MARNKLITQKKLDGAMVKLQDMFCQTNMRDKGVSEWFDKTIHEVLGSNQPDEIGPNYVYYPDWDDDWDDWTEDLKLFMREDSDLVITAVGSYDMGIEDDRIIVLCYDVKPKGETK